MSRSSRIFIDNACYHIMVRGNQKQKIFYDQKDYTRYLRIVKSSKKKYNILIYAYCLMPNHCHLLIDAAISKNISKFMQWINRGYTAYHNAKYNKSGHLWQGRFKNKPITKGQYLISCATYIEANPVRTGLTNDIAEYPWSSYTERCYLCRQYLLDEIKINCVYND